jgi:hypothetical protein
VGGEGLKQPKCPRKAVCVWVGGERGAGLLVREHEGALKLRGATGLGSGRDAGLAVGAGQREGDVGCALPLGAPRLQE